MFGKRGAKIHTILIKDNGHSDAKMFGECRVKSRQIMARSLFEKEGYDLALEELRMAREHIVYYVTGEGSVKEGDAQYVATKASQKKLRSQEKEIMKLRAKITEKKKELLKIEKARAKAMFAEKPQTKENTATPNGESPDVTEKEATETNQVPKVEAKEVQQAPEKKEAETIQQRRVSFSPKLEERYDFVEKEEEEEDPWYEDHKEAIILLALGGLAYASFLFTRSRRS